MLGLKLPTDPRWVNLTEKSLEDILTDHAYCEQKAASSGISIIQQYPDYPFIVDALSPVVAEEWGHFRMVLAQLQQRGLRLGRQRKDEYVQALSGFVRKGVSREEALMDKLLLCALIEARSCERFRLLSQHIGDEELRRFYKNLMVSEAGHYTLFLQLAKQVRTEQEVMIRWNEWLEFEAGVIDQLELRGDRMH